MPLLTAFASISDGSSLLLCIGSQPHYVLHTVVCVSLAMCYTLLCVRALDDVILLQERLVSSAPRLAFMTTLRISRY